jgi:hypothetical protein
MKIKSGRYFKEPLINDILLILELRHISKKALSEKNLCQLDIWCHFQYDPSFKYDNDPANELYMWAYNRINRLA